MSSSRSSSTSCRAGTFREDLFYRLNIVEIRMPGLRERPEDIDTITLDIISGIAARRDVEPWQIDHEALALLRGHPWPGNILQVWFDGPLECYRSSAPR